MLNLEVIKPKIVELLKPLKPNKIILFGSYAYGTPTEDSDLDIFLIKDNLTIEETRYYQREAKKRLLNIRKEYKTNGIDILAAPTEYIENRDDYFYKVDILQNGKVWYEQASS